jgi:hypothetical protein
MVLAKRQALKRNQRRRKMLRMSKTESLSFSEGDRLDLAPPFTVAWSEPEETDGEVEVMWMSCGAGEGMHSGEYMVVKAKEDEDTRGCQFVGMLPQ